MHIIYSKLLSFFRWEFVVGEDQIGEMSERFENERVRVWGGER